MLSPIFIDHEISFTLAALGGATEIPTINKPLKLKIRSGTQPGSLFRLRNQGAPRLRGRGRGDQYVRLIVKIPKRLSREQKELLQKFAKTT